MSRFVTQRANNDPWDLANTFYTSHDGSRFRVGRAVTRWGVYREIQGPTGKPAYERVGERDYGSRTVARVVAVAQKVGDLVTGVLPGVDRQQPPIEQASVGGEVPVVAGAEVTELSGSAVSKALVGAIVAGTERPAA